MVLEEKILDSYQDGTLGDFCGSYFPNNSFLSLLLCQAGCRRTYLCIILSLFHFLYIPLFLMLFRMVEKNSPFPVMNIWPYHYHYLCEDIATVACLDHRVRCDKLDMVAPESSNQTLWHM